MSALNSPSDTRAPLNAGLVAGAAAAIAAVLLSLGLKSPDDVFINSATVGGAALILGIVAGLGWKLLGRTPNGSRVFAATWVVGALIAVGLAVSSDRILEGFTGFGVPIALLCFAITGGLTRLLSPVLVGRWWVSLGSVAVALVMSVALAGHRSSSSEVAPVLPPQSAAVVPTQSAAVAPAPAQAIATSAEAVAVPAQAAAASTVGATARATAPATPKPAARTPGTYTGVNFAVGQGSKATFTVRETLARMPMPNDAVVSTSSLSGEIHLDGRPSSVDLDLQRLSSDQPQRDKYIKTNMFPNDKLATFTVDDAPALTDGSPPDDLKGTLDGSLKLKGGTFPLSFDWQGRDEGGAFYLLAHTTVAWKDLGLDPPSSSAIVSTEDTIDVDILLATRPR